VVVQIIETECVSEVKQCHLSHSSCWFVETPKNKIYSGSCVTFIAVVVRLVIFLMKVENFHFGLSTML